jgi:hypothetical protein
MVCALTEYAVAVTSAAAANVVANFCMLISDFDARKTSVQESERNLSAVPSRSNIIVPPRACSRFGPAILHRSSASLYAQRNGYQGHEPATLENARLASKLSAGSQKDTLLLPRQPMTC